MGITLAPSGCLYRINTGEGAVEISANGVKSVETDIGWHR